MVAATVVVVLEGEVVEVEEVVVVVEEAAAALWPELHALSVSATPMSATALALTLLVPSPLRCLVTVASE